MLSEIRREETVQKSTQGVVEPLVLRDNLAHDGRIGWISQHGVSCFSDDFVDLAN